MPIFFALGAGKVIDYKTAKFENEIQEKVDLVFDLVGGDVQQRSYAILKKGGYLVAANQPVSKDEAAKHKVHALMMNMVPSAKGVAEIVQLLQDKKVKPDVGTVQYLPASFHTFLYVIDGSIEAGEERKRLQQNQVGWLDKSFSNFESELQLTAGKSGAKLVLYAGEPQHAAIVSQGPFIGDNRDDMVRLYKEFHQGKMKHISTLPESQLVNY